ncbi:MAG: 30S ribosomal protein S27e [Candidatus Caldarchaeum sp.]|nr:30S ribosomal protein S27e [Candidatus Caldarchaeum sp.]
MTAEQWPNIVPTPKSRFLLVTCNECGNTQVVFDSAKINVKCNVCGAILAKPSGGKAIILGKKERTLE